MLRSILRAAALIAGTILVPSVIAQTPSIPARAAEVSFHMERVGLPVPVFTIRVQQDGTGEYFGDETLTSTKDAPPVPRPFRRPIGLSAATTARIFSTTKLLRQFQVTCLSSARHVADTGTKTLSYTGPDGSGSCTYNYSENKYVQSLTDIFLALAYTMDTGRKLEFEHRFERLALDAETESLAHALQQGRAIEILTIASALEGIAADMEIMERVRYRAARMLQTARDGIAKDETATQAH